MFKAKEIATAYFIRHKASLRNGKVILAVNNMSSAVIEMEYPNVVPGADYVFGIRESQGEVLVTLLF